jgi:transcriptional antiterminator NusG
MSEEKELRWYIVHTYSGFENRVKSSLEERIKTLALDRYFGRILVPTEQVVELRKGSKKTSSRKFYPGISWSKCSLMTKPGIS